MTPLETLIADEKKKARTETQSHCQKGYEGILQQEVIDGTVSYWGKRTDTLLTTAMQRAYEAGQSEERARIRESFNEWFKNSTQDVEDWADRNLPTNQGQISR